MNIAADCVPAVRVEFLGRTRVFCDGISVERRLSARALLLFAMLVTQREDPLWRDDLAFGLWPDFSETDAKAALRRHLYQIKQILPTHGGSWIECNNKTVAWHGRGDTWVDAAEFVRLSKSADVECAVELYAGDFLPHVDHDWAHVTRERLRGTATALLANAIANRKARLDAAGCLRYVEQLLAIDPWREDVFRELLLLRFHLGDRAGAVASYRNFQVRLRLELGVDPMPETARCYERIVAGADPDYFRISSSFPTFANA